MKEYRGFKIEKAVGVINVGYAPARINKTKHTITQRTRKVTGWYVYYPDGGSRWCNTLKEAKDYIDSYLS